MTSSLSLSFSRRNFLANVGMVTAGSALPKALLGSVASSPFRVAVINDEISQDFERACQVASGFGMKWIELRGMWSKNILDLDANQISESQRLLRKYDLRVTDIASPLFKVDWLGAPKSKFSPKHDEFNAHFGPSQQDAILEKCVEMAKKFSTDRVRCFDFWRLDDPKPFRAEINETLRKAAEKLGKQGLTLVLENEMSCNTGTGKEAAEVLAAVETPSFMLNWDPGNAATLGEIPYPDGYRLLPKNRIGHCHCKDVVKNGDKYDWAAMGKGIIDWVGQFRALHQAGYKYAVSLETHWQGGGTPEASTGQSWAGMKDELLKAGVS
jgi:sugar phosphate isomerase/epimerase